MLRCAQQIVATRRVHGRGTVGRHYRRVLAQDVESHDIENNCDDDQEYDDDQNNNNDSNVEEADRVSFLNASARWW